MKLKINMRVRLKPNPNLYVQSEKVGTVKKIEHWKPSFKVLILWDNREVGWYSHLGLEQIEE